MISALTTIPLARMSRRGLEDRPRLHLGDFRVGDAEPAAAMAHHRVELVEFLDAHADLAGRDLHLVRQGLWPASSCGTNSCNGGSSRRIVTGRPLIARNRSSKSARWIGNSLASACGGRLVVGQDHLAHRLDAVAFEEHVLGAAQADALAPKLRATFASSGVSALVRTSSCL